MWPREFSGPAIRASSASRAPGRVRSTIHGPAGSASRPTPASKASFDSIWRRASLKPDSAIDAKCSGTPRFSHVSRWRETRVCEGDGHIGGVEGVPDPTFDEESPCPNADTEVGEGIGRLSDRVGLVVLEGAEEGDFGASVQC